MLTKYKRYNWVNVSADEITLNVSADKTTVNVSADKITLNVSADEITLNVSADEITLNLDKICSNDYMETHIMIFPTWLVYSGLKQPGSLFIEMSGCVQSLQFTYSML